MLVSCPEKKKKERQKQRANWTELPRETAFYVTDCVLYCRLTTFFRFASYCLPTLLCKLTRQLTNSTSSFSAPLPFNLRRDCFLSVTKIQIYVTNLCFLVDMSAFSKRRYPLSGPAFHDRYKDVSAKNAMAFETLTRYATIMAPKRWIDTLSAQQHELFHYITAKQQMTARLAEQVEGDLEQVPCMAVSITGEEQDRFLVLATFSGRVLCLSLRMLADRLGGLDEDAYAFVVPAKVNEWLRRANVVKLGTRPPNWMRSNPYGFVVNCYVETVSVFLHYQDVGIISPRPKALEPTEEWQCLYAVDYHHRPASRDDMRELLGPLQYKGGRRPYARQQRWAPQSTVKLTPATVFYLYYEAASLQLFINRLLRHALVYGGVPSARRFTTIGSLYESFLDRCLRITAQYYVGEQEERRDDGGDDGGDDDDDGGRPPALRPSPDANNNAHQTKTEPTLDTDPLAALQRDRELHESPKPSTSGRSRCAPPSPPREPDVAAAPAPAEGDADSEDVQFFLVNDDLIWGEGSEDSSARRPRSIRSATATAYAASNPEKRITFSNDDCDSDSTADFFSARSVFVRSPQGKRKRVEAPDATHNIAPHTAKPGSRPGPPLADPSVPSPHAPKPVAPSTAQDASSPSLAPHMPPTSTAKDASSSSTARDASSTPSVTTPPPSTARDASPSTATSARSSTARDASRHTLRHTRTSPKISWATKIEVPATEAPMSTFRRNPCAPPPAKRARDSVVTFDRQDLRARINLMRQLEELKAEPQDSEATIARPFDINTHLVKTREAKSMAQRKYVALNLKGAFPGAFRQSDTAFSRHHRLVDELTEEELLENQFAAKPRFHLLCTFCAGTHCSPTRSDTGTINCRRLEYHREKTPSRQICSYLRCHSKNTHMVDTCPALHGKCPICSCRGHSVEDGCNVEDEEIMEALFADFEMSGDDGIYTVRRWDEDPEGSAAWGFFPMDHSSATKLSYRHLRRLPVLEALALVNGVASLKKSDKKP